MLLRTWTVYERSRRPPVDSEHRPTTEPSAGPGSLLRTVRATAPCPSPAERLRIQRRRSGRPRAVRTVRWRRALLQPFDQRAIRRREGRPAREKAAVRAIAAALGLTPSAISREIRHDSAEGAKGDDPEGDGHGRPSTRGSDPAPGPSPPHPDRFNCRPRKTLGWETPAERLHTLLAAWTTVGHSRQRPRRPELPVVLSRRCREWSSGSGAGTRRSTSSASFCRGAARSPAAGRARAAPGAASR